VSLVRREDHGRVAVLVLNNPPANGYSHAMHQALDAHVVGLRMDDGIDVIVLRGEGERFFCAGADIAYLQSLAPSQKYAFCLHANETLLRIENTPKLVIAALNGHCVGGGLEVAMACDLRLGRASAGKPNLVGLPEVSLGVLPGTGGTQRLSRLVGNARALQLMVDGANLAVEEAARLGIVNEVLPADGWWEAVLARAASYCRPGKAAGAIGLIKRAVHGGADLPIERGLALERELQQRLFTAPDAAEGLAAFTEKRAAVFAGAGPAASARADGGGDSGAATDLAVRPARGAPREGFSQAAGTEEKIPSHGPVPAGVERIDLSRTRLHEQALNRVPRELVERWNCIPVRIESGTLVLAMSDPGDGEAVAAIEGELGLRVRPVAADPFEVAAAIGQHYRA
jgi:enoyl-CoA hydratase/carnithine racemase